MKTDNFQPQSKTKNIFRWIVFIPAAFAGSSLAYLASILFFGAGSWLSGFPFMSPMNQIMASGLSGYAAIFIAAYVAPSEDKKIPIIIVATLLVLAGLVSLAIRANNSEWLRVAEGIALLFGMLASISSVSKNGAWKF